MVSQAEGESQASSNSETRPLLRNDGILIDREHLKRKDAVKEIIELARSKQYVILASPPATGKTSLLQLVQQELRRQGATTKKLHLTGYLTIGEVKGKLNQVGFTADEDDMENVRNTWLLLDDAQNWYKEEYWPFWQFLMKGLPQVSFGRCFVIVAATYDLSTP